MAGRRHQAKRQRRDGVRIPDPVHAGDAIIFRQNQRGEHQKQFCAHLRVIGRDTGLRISAELRHGRTENVHHTNGCQVAEQRGTDADHFSGDRTDRLATRGHQISSQRAVPGRVGVRQSAHVATGPGAVSARCRPHTHEVLSERYARVQVRYQRQNCHGVQRHQDP